MPVAIPRSARLASPRLDGSGTLWIVAGAVAGLASAIFLSGIGYPLGAALVVASVLIARRRRTVGAYEGVEGVVVRNWFATHEVLWVTTQRVEDRRDPWVPWFRVPFIVHGAGAGDALPVSGLRHRPGTNPAAALTLTRSIRDRRDERNRDRW